MTSGSKITYHAFEIAEVAGLIRVSLPQGPVVLYLSTEELEVFIANLRIIAEDIRRT